MSAAHTPGPWVVDLNEHGDKSRRFIWSDADYARNGPDDPHTDTGFCIAIVQPRTAPGTLEANACLIAAAPDLLEAVQAAIEFASKPCTDGEVDVSRLDALHRLCVAAKRKAVHS